jgi:hypothetical protein
MRTKTFAVVALVLVVLWSVGCSSAAKPAETAVTPDDSAGVTETLAPEAATIDDAQYIRDMGKSHKGETLQLLIVATEKTKAAADQTLLDLLPVYGDIQTYLVVEPTAQLKGLEPGSWVVFEAYRKAPSQETIDFMDRGSSPATVKQVTVLTTDPIPVVEDLEGDGSQ